MRKLTIAFLLVIFLLSSTLYAQGEQPDKDSAFYIRSGWESVSSGQIKEANVDFQKALELEPENTEALEGLAKTSMYLDKHQEAEEAFSRILDLEPDNIDAMVRLAQIYSWTGRYEEAIALYIKVLELEPENAEAKTGLAEVYKWAGFRKESINQYKKLLSEDPRNVKAYRGLAEVYIWDDRLNEAERIYSDALKSMPDNIELHLGLAKIYTWIARWSKAEEEYNKVLELEPGNAEALKGIKDVKQELLPIHNFILTYISEQDGDSWEAYTTTLGYKQTRFFDNGNSFYAAYYLINLDETDKNNRTGNTVELGGEYNFTDKLTILGYADMSTYSHGLDFSAGVGIDSVLKFYDKNTLTLRYSSELFDALDEIRRDSYGAESNIYLGNYILLTNAYTYGDLSDGNNSTDIYHNLTFLVLKNEPDMNIGIGYRKRDFDEYAKEYYSPEDLESWIYSFYIGRTFEKYTPYFLFKFIDNSDNIDNYYYLGGVDYRLNDTCSLTGEISYFDTTADYSALTVIVILGIKF